MRREKADKGE